ncbi:nuclear transport factor 2 family protein [Parapedobacter sp. ISTM3]|uniref:SnoaL-like domain-containing protein n=1 Tax=Parapedobacter luteus TaxID=623280 RepID=A0A1T5DZH5_9SPHI|nr:MULTISPECIES: nuclear transport factor 2 family protein [Parapedobacter]MBK1442650.1 nuclear transport factor 2 family protein [Parapedobacter sp. ISTM3]SKB77137.1 hypothetical protein SAMN05660226_03036 [Parapedobacter luteus]
MDLPKIITALINAQRDHDSAAYADCFSQTAVVFDEGRIYRGRTEIHDWIANANEKYQTVMQPVSFEGTEATGVLTAAVSGTFPGSPAVLKFYVGIADDLIQSLKVTG